MQAADGEREDDGRDRAAAVVALLLECQHGDKVEVARALEAASSEVGFWSWVDPVLVSLNGHVVEACRTVGEKGVLIPVATADHLAQAVATYWSDRLRMSVDDVSSALLVPYSLELARRYPASIFGYFSTLALAALTSTLDEEQLVGLVRAAVNSTEDVEGRIDGPAGATATA